MQNKISLHGIKITDVFHCPFLESEDRKPNAGMFLKAQKKYDIDMQASISVGDKARDVAAGENAGVGQNILFAGSYADIISSLGW